MTTPTDNELWKLAQDIDMPNNAALLIARSSTQTLSLMLNERQINTYAISTSRNGLGNDLDSYRTPTGFHEISERYGDGQPPGRVFFERVATNRSIAEADWQAASGTDLILTRILRLSGREPGVNLGGSTDTFDRYVYLHGSDNEHHLGQAPCSQGCIHVGNNSIIDLYDRIHEVPAWCWIG